MNMKNFTLCLILIAIVSVGCKKSTFVPDPLDGDLPAYTESGNNTAGAYVNGDPWVDKASVGMEFHTNEALYIANVNTAGVDSTVFYFNGTIDKGALINTSVYINVVVKGLSLSTPDDLIRLNDKKIVLDGIRNYVIINASTISTYYTVPKLEMNKKGTGEFYIKRTQVESHATLGGNGPTHPIILSGTFNFDIGTTKITSGRFDIYFMRPFGQY
ncbi:hypothetical protein GCM10028826_32040 [Mucilaginibacter boryungensis]